ncbi:MAG: isoleucine--tRNA ligase, partial [Pseudomonadales bacterium]
AYNSYQFHQIYQKLHNFCVVDLGGIYLDIIKDRQYTMQADSVGRRSAQTALYHIIQAFTRWVAPILSFTADELFENIPGQQNESVFLQELYAGVSDLLAEDANARSAVETLCEVKMVVNRALEEKRGGGDIGSSLEAEVTLYASTDIADKLALFGEELRFALITSTATVVVGEPPADAANVQATDMAGLSVLVQKSEHEKCVRCWHHRQDVGSEPEHPALCARCVLNVDGQGEQRHFA